MSFRDRAIIDLDTVDSTNNYAANMLKLSSPPAGTVITAQEQTNGRGQRGSSWTAFKGDNLLASIIVYPKFLAPDETFMLSRITALAIREAIEALTDKDVFIKWPNDIIVGGKKICGILIENNWSDFKIQSAIIGFGINVNQEKFMIPKATSVKNVIGHFIPISEIQKTTLAFFDNWYSRLESGQKDFIKAEYEKHLFKKNEMAEFIFEDRKIKASIQGVNASGHLILLDSEGNKLSADLKQIAMLY
jgi:BirA family transcriptional regulator, biotin operon repressor / biotin---[acetyl-CoA-carboxylase] ligase